MANKAFVVKHGLNPSTDNSVDLGTSSLEFKNLYIDGTAFLDAIGFGSTAITLPSGAGNDGQVLKSNGSNALTWEDASTGGHTIQEEGSSLTQRTKLNFIGASITATDDSHNDATKITVTTPGASLPVTRSDGSTSDPIALTSAALGESLVSDTSPQLGGNLDVNGQSIVSDASNENIPITPHGTGSVVISKADINAGAIDNTTIGATTASTIAGTTLSATGNVSFDGGSFVFNESGADKDFRIEGDSDANLFMADASTDRIGIGVAAPDNQFHMKHSGQAWLKIQGEGTGNDHSGINITTDAKTWNVAASHANSTAIGSNLFYWWEQTAGKVMTLDTSGNLRLKGGISVSNETDAAHTLDDYEEGSFTPIVKYGSSSYSVDWSDGRYVKVGDLVHFQLAAQIITSSSNDGNAITITGLPFTSYNSVASHVRFFGSWEYYSGGAVGTFYLNQNNTYLSGLIQKQDGNAWQAISSSMVYRSSGSNEVFASGTYIAA